jgi:asparagine synthase (glutamine-hydrolysing)
MCGLVTVMTSGGRTFPAPVLTQLTDLLRHRGPDDAGYVWVEPAAGRCRTFPEAAAFTGELSGVLFGHRRLSVIDLTAAGHQPFVSDDGTLVLSYNGEIYNYIELRSELESRGPAFRSRTDTEVLLRAYELWGADAFARLNGMWAFTLWDGRRGVLLACRDRFGVKPLYYTQADDLWCFASEIKALLALPGFDRRIDRDGVVEFLARGATDHRTETLFHGVRAVPPGSFIEVSGSGVSSSGVSATKRYWTLRPDPDVGRLPDPDAVERFRRLLRDAVALRVRSDVPIGTMLSGGLDSTSIAALVRERASGSTFSACWPGLPLDEEPAIDRLCQHLDLTSSKVYVTGEEALEVLPAVIRHLDEPFSSPVATVNYVLMRQARASGVPVVLNGHGADEALAGYPERYVAARLADLLLSGRLPSFLAERRPFVNAGSVSDKHLLAALYRLLSPRGHERPESPGWTTRPTRLQSLQYAEHTARLLPQWLRMEDRMSMAHSVESRLPFMDYRLVEFAFAIRDSLKIRDGWTKFILRSAMSGQLPPEIGWNRRKQRFAVPFGDWIRQSWRPMVSDLFLSGDAHVGQFLKLESFRTKLQAYLEGRRSGLSGSLLWRVLSTELWLRQNRSPARIP